MTLLHSHTAEGFGGFFEEALLHSLLDTLKLIPFLFITYLLMEFIEHRASQRTLGFIRKCGALGPLPASLVGAIPQCGFSAAAANLYTGRVISLGTLVALFLSTSDEMLAILISGGVSLPRVLTVIAYKIIVAVITGFAIDAILRLFGKKNAEINIDELCGTDECHCERGILHSAIHHTLTTGLFILIVTVAINAAIFFIGENAISSVFLDKPFLSHAIAAVFGLIPNCAASVTLATLASDGLITVGTMLSGLFSGCGVGILVLFKVNKNIKQNFAIVAVLLAVGFCFGVLADFLPFVFETV
ncbi:MAG: hypothetical protein E7612_02090 [Ruminococcaceae bacterium]|nr:hypothetical protein [Oscillospiraceae bacterium]